MMRLKPSWHLARCLSMALVVASCGASAKPLPPPVLLVAPRARCLTVPPPPAPSTLATLGETGQLSDEELGALWWWAETLDAYARRAWDLCGRLPAGDLRGAGVDQPGER